MIEFDRSEIKRISWALAYCVATALLFFRGPILTPHLYHIPYDLESYHHPLTTFIAATLRDHGHLPWWNPYSYLGEPFSGNVQAALFYPPTLAVALLGALFRDLPYWITEADLAAHTALAGFGAYLFLRALGATNRASLTGASIFQLGAFFASQTEHLGAISVCAWLPYFLGALYRLHERLNFRWVGASAVFLALMILPGFPAGYLPAYVFGPLLFILWINTRQPIWPAWRGAVRPMLLMICAIGVGTLLAAVSWLPAFHLSGRSQAATRSFYAAVGGFPAEGLTSLIWPNLFGQLRGEYWLGWDFTMMYYYQGVVALVLFFGGVTWMIRSAKVRPFLIGAGVSALWMIGNNSFLSLLLYMIYPRFARKGIYPYCLLAYFSLFVAIACAQALSAYETGERRRIAPSRQVLRIAFMLGIIATVVCVLGVFSGNNPPLLGRAVTAGGSLIFVSTWFALCWLALRDQSKTDAQNRGRVSAALCVLVILDLVSTGSHSKANNYDGYANNTPPVVGFLRQQVGPAYGYRMYTSELSYTWQTTVPQWRLPSANGFNPFILEDTRAYLTGFSNTADGRQYNLTSADSPLLDLAGIGFIVTPRETLGQYVKIYQGEVNVFQNPRAFPRFFLVGGVSTTTGVGDAVVRIHTASVAPSQVALVSSGDAKVLAVDGEPAKSDELGKVDVISYEPNAIELRVTAHRRAVLIATETFWDEWVATEDGKRVPLVRADGLFRAVPVSAGTHVIRMHIVPRSLYYGAAISLACLILCLFWFRFGGHLDRTMSS